MAHKRIGELLLDRGVINKDQLATGLAAQQRTRARLGVTLIQQGVITEVQLAQVLGQSLGLATVDLPQVQVDWSAVHLLRAPFCELHELFPFAVDGKGTASKRVMVAMSDPLNQPALQEIEFTTGLSVQPFVSTYSQIRAAILRYYHKVPEAVAQKATPLVGTPASISLQPVAPEVDEPLTMRPASNPAVAAVRKGPASSVTKDLDFLFGNRPDDDELQALEQKFWTLMKLLSKKGIVSAEEFLRELDDAD